MKSDIPEEQRVFDWIEDRIVSFENGVYDAYPITVELKGHSIPSIGYSESYPPVFRMYGKVLNYTEDFLNRVVIAFDEKIEKQIADILEEQVCKVSDAVDDNVQVLVCDSCTGSPCELRVLNTRDIGSAYGMVCPFGGNGLPPVKWRRVQ